MFDNLLESWPAISKAVIFILLELLGFIFIIRLQIFYIPSISTNRLLGRIVGLIISLVFSWFYIKTLVLFVPTDEAMRIIFYLVFVMLNFIMVRKMYG